MELASRQPLVDYVSDLMLRLHLLQPHSWIPFGNVSMMLNPTCETSTMNSAMLSSPILLNACSRMETLSVTDLLLRLRVLSLQTEVANGKNSRNRSATGSGRRPVVNQTSSFISCSKKTNESAESFPEENRLTNKRLDFSKIHRSGFEPFQCSTNFVMSPSTLLAFQRTKLLRRFCSKLRMMISFEFILPRFLIGKIHHHSWSNNTIPRNCECLQIQIEHRIRTLQEM